MIVSNKTFRCHSFSSHAMNANLCIPGSANVAGLDKTMLDTIVGLSLAKSLSGIRK